jgi:T5SS/PEP-CTERM-associated repeat protein
MCLRTFPVNIDHRIACSFAQFVARIRWPMSSLLILYSLCGYLVPSVSGQQTKRWIAGGAGVYFFDDDFAWESTGAPGTSDSALFDLSSSYTVNWDGITGDRTNANLTVVNGQVTFRRHPPSQGGPYTYTISGETRLAQGATLNLGVVGSPLNLTTRSLDIFSGAHLHVASGSTLSLTGTNVPLMLINGSASFETSASLIAPSGTTRWLVNSSQLTFEDGGVGIRGGTVYKVHSGSILNIQGDEGSLVVGAPGTGGELQVAGAGSRVNVARDATVGGTGSPAITVSDAGSLSVGGFLDVGYGTLGTLTIQGIGSRVDVGQKTFVGDLGAGILNVLEGGQFVSGSLGTTIRSAGTIHIDGGYADLKTLTMLGGQINFVSGSLSFIGDLNVGSGGQLGSNLTLGQDRRLEIQGATIVAPFRSLILDGGSLSTRELTIQDGGIFDFRKGNLIFNDVNGVFAIGHSGALGSTVSLGSQQAISALNQVHVQSEGQLNINQGARLTGGQITNQGRIQLAGSDARIQSSTSISNQGLLSGTGRVAGNVLNQSGGLIQVDAGGRLTFSHDVSNMAGGRITGRGIIEAPKIENHGQLLFSGGFTDLFADIQSTTGSQFIVTGGSTTTVFGDVEIMGGAELRISESSNAVFFDHVQLRNGSLLTGGGQAYFEGSLGIGNSPSRQTFNFNVTLGATSNLLVEIAGTDPEPPEFDQYVFLRDLTLLGGALTIDLIGLNPGDPIFAPQLGDSFRIIEVSGLWTGQFGTYNFPTLAPELRWDRSNLYTGGIISVAAVPEPGGALVVVFVLSLGLFRRSRDAGTSFAELPSQV